MSKDIIRMAREAGGYPAATTDRALLLFSESHLERFADLIRADERDKFCAVLRQLHDSYSMRSIPGHLQTKGAK